MAEKSLKPEIRFAGFTEDWEQRKLSDFLVTSTDKNLDNLYTKQDVLSVSGEFGVVNQIEFQGRSFAGVSVSNYGVVSTGDVVYTKSPLSSNPYGIVKTNKGRPGIVSTLYAIYHPMPSTDSNFIQVYFEQNARVNNYLHPLVNKGAKNDMKVTADNALKGLVIFPKCKEQKRISELFAFLDNLITLHQRKCDKLIDFKKAMLEKMFPKDGTDMPEIRFAGFTGAWEKHRFESICTRKVSYSNKSGLPRVEYEDIVPDVGELNKDIYQKENSKPGIQFDTGDILFGKLRPYLKNWIFSKFKGIAVGDFWILRSAEADNKFIYYLIQSTTFQEVVNQTSGTKMPRADWNLVSKSSFFIPTDIAEQHKIGVLFTHIDNLITLHQRELEKLKNIKKAMLDKMFV
jgi:type I restriction enzyme S subunit